MANVTSHVTHYATVLGVQEEKQHNAKKRNAGEEPGTKTSTGKR
jgi:hypothetical protein